jgi:hypothetical protein
MTAKLAKFRIFDRDRAALAASPCNDNRFARRLVQAGQRKRQILVCRWHRVAPTGALECRWHLESGVSSTAEEPEIKRLVAAVLVLFGVGIGNDNATGKFKFAHG